jgi:hypothetical protein
MNDKAQEVGTGRASPHFRELVVQLRLRSFQQPAGFYEHLFEMLDRARIVTILGGDKGALEQRDELPQFLNQLLG